MAGEVVLVLQLSLSILAQGQRLNVTDGELDMEGTFSFYYILFDILLCYAADQHKQIRYLELSVCKLSLERRESAMCLCPDGVDASHYIYSQEG